MDLQNLNQTCPDCGEWFTEDEVYRRGTARLNDAGDSTLFCPKCKDIVLQDAEEWDIQTPYEKLQVEFVAAELGNLEERIIILREQLARLQHNR